MLAFSRVRDVYTSVEQLCMYPGLITIFASRILELCHAAALNATVFTEITALVESFARNEVLTTA